MTTTTWLIPLGKAALLIFWAGELLNLFRLIPPPLDTIFHIAAVTVLVVHIIAAGVFTRLHGRELVEPKLHKMQILIFGVFHWLDLLRKGRIKSQGLQRR